MGNRFGKPVIFVKRSDSKKGKLWNDLANKRSIQQHGDVDELPEDDLHAVKKFFVPELYPTADPEETEEAVSSLEEEIQQLREKGNPLPSPGTNQERTITDDFTDHYDDK
jgi:hypothetical protein